MSPEPLPLIGIPFAREYGGHDHEWGPSPATGPGYALYDAMRDSLTEDLLPVAAFMECSGRYDDAAVHDAAFVLEGNGLFGVPDLCHYLQRVSFWGTTVDEHAAPAAGGQVPWAKILGQCLPLPCRARALCADLAAHLAHGTRDFVLRVLLAGLLGVYTHTSPEGLPMRARIMAYAAFSVHPPDNDQLARFILERPKLVLYAMKEYVFFMVRQVRALHAYLCRTCEWAAMDALGTQAMDAVRREMGRRALGIDFMRDGAMWHAVEVAAQVYNHRILRHSYRTCDETFFKRVIACFNTLATRGKAPHVSESLAHEAYAFTATFEARPGGNLYQEIADFAAWGVSPAWAAELEAAKDQFTASTNLTGVSHVLSRMYASKDRDNLGQSERDNHGQARDDYSRVYIYARACVHRLSFRWAFLPVQWARAQFRAVGSSFDAGAYPVCLKCREILGDTGRTSKKKPPSAYPSSVCVRMRGTECELVCKRRGVRKHDATLKRQSRGLSSSSSTSDQDPKTRDIEVCCDVPVAWVNMIGRIFRTERDGYVVLCVDCGVLIPWDPLTVRDRGPTCGCVAETSVPMHTCSFCKRDMPFKHMRGHKMLRKSGVETVYVCRAHRTHWVDTWPALPIYKELKHGVLNRQRHINVGGIVQFLQP